eukprot:TRINITY_DN20502_c0_g1_i1.p1 TRINITY_DN20502_c0_g1~~TRINITY_DN20502_c0_g1_i1.p1  ORF type:complete len:273 (+),score=23.75 TRINITY_DN20502_c0_g1_i1:119-820(+)
MTSLKSVWWRPKGRSGPITRIDFSTKKSRRGKGLFYCLATKRGNRLYRNPYKARLVTVTCSSLQTGYPERLVDFVPKPFSTYNCLNSWMAVTLAPKHLFRATHYSFSRYVGAFSPRSWNLQASVNGTQWSTLDTQTDNEVLDVMDETEEGESKEDVGTGISTDEDYRHLPLSNPMKVAAFPISGELGQGWYNSFRILQTDRNNGGNYKLCLCSFELYGMLRQNDNSTKRAIVM